MSSQGDNSKKGTLLGGIGIAALALKFKGALMLLLKLGWLSKGFLTMFLSLGLYTMAFGWPYAAAIVLLLFIHESGHWIFMKALGLEPKAPIFIPFLGAFAAMTKLPEDAMTRAWVGFAGPLVGAVGSAVMYWGGMHWQNGWLLAAASTGFLLNLIQLIPAKPLDGGFVVQAISKWLLLPGAVVLIWFAYELKSVLFMLIGIIAGIAVVRQLFGKKSAIDVEHEPTPATFGQKIIIGIAYLSLTGMLGYLYMVSGNRVGELLQR